MWWKIKNTGRRLSVKPCSITREISHTGVVEAMNTGRRPCRRSSCSPEKPTHTGVVESKGTQEEGHVAKPLFNREPTLYRYGGSQWTQEEGHVMKPPVQLENPNLSSYGRDGKSTETVTFHTKTEYNGRHRYTDESLLQKRRGRYCEIRRL